MKNKVVFVETDSPIRTHEECLQRGDIAHYASPTYLAELKIRLTKQVHVDYMHAVCLGKISTQLINYIIRHHQRLPEDFEGKN